MSVPTSIEITAKLESRDFWRYYFGYFFSFESIIWNALISVVFTLLLLFLMFDDKLFLRFGWRFIFVGLIFFVILLGFYNTIVHVRTAQKLARSEAAYSFAEDGVTAKTSAFESKLQWSYLTRIKETNNYFCIFLRGGNYYYIPKRFFRDPEDIIRLRELFNRKVGKEVYLKSSGRKLGLK